MTASAAWRDADDLRCVRERRGGALLRGRRGRPLPALRREGALRSSLPPLPPTRRILQIGLPAASIGVTHEATTHWFP